MGQLGRLLIKRQGQVDRLEREKAVLLFEERLAQREAQELQVDRPGAVGFTEAMLAHFDKERQGVLESQPERLRTRLSEDLDQRRPPYAERFATQEFGDSRRYFRDGLEQSLDAQVAKIGADPEAAPSALATMADLIGNSPLPEGERETLQQASATAIGEAWARTLPPQGRLDLLGRLEAQGAGEADVAAGLDPEMLALLQHLPEDRRNRLRWEAQDNLASADIVEGEDLAERIMNEGAAFDAAALEESRLLSPHRKRAFGKLLEYRLRRDSEERTAAAWALDASVGNPFSDEDRRRADEAYKRLGVQGIGPETVARALLRNKRLLPDAHAGALLGHLDSTQAERVQAGFDDLLALREIDSGSVDASTQGRRLRDRLAKWRTLTETRGLQAAEAARLLAAANDPATRERLASGPVPAPVPSATDVLDNVARLPERVRPH